MLVIKLKIKKKINSGSEYLKIVVLIFLNHYFNFDNSSHFKVTILNHKYIVRIYVFIITFILHFCFCRVQAILIYYY